jgi:hypothetical protein
LVIIDQSASIGALVIAVARKMDIDVAYLPGLAMRRIADLYPGEGKTDARDAFIIADAARTMPHTLRRVGTDDETIADLTVLAGYDDDLATQSTRLTNRLRDALLHVHPALERLLGKHFDRPGVLELLVAAPTPDALARLAPEAMTEIMKPRSPRLAKPCPRRSSPRSTSRASPPRAPRRSAGSSPASPPSCATSTSNAPVSAPIWRHAWRPTLFTRS